MKPKHVCTKYPKRTPLGLESLLIHVFWILLGNHGITFHTKRSLDLMTFNQNNPGELHSLKLTYPLKMDGWNTTFLLGRPIFGGYASFREGNLARRKTSYWSSQSNFFDSNISLLGHCPRLAWQPHGCGQILPAGAHVLKTYVSKNHQDE